MALYALLCIIWGSTWLVIKVGYGGLGPFNVARFASSSPAPSRPRSCRSSAPAGREAERNGASSRRLVCVLFAADYGLIYWSEQFLDSGLTAILFATLPIITATMAHLYLPGDRITPRKRAQYLARAPATASVND